MGNCLLCDSVMQDRGSGSGERDLLHKNVHVVDNIGNCWEGELYIKKFFKNLKRTS